MVGFHEKKDVMMRKLSKNILFLCRTGSGSNNVVAVNMESGRSISQREYKILTVLVLNQRGNAKKKPFFKDSRSSYLLFPAKSVKQRHGL